jgi:hypothetical protein
MSEFREPMFNRRGKPQIIRTVVRWSNMKQPGGMRRSKKARDLRTGLEMERIKARADRPCAADLDCTRGTGVIYAGTEYAKIPDGSVRPMRIRGTLIYPLKDYHFDCVPEIARPLVRFFKD